MERHFGEIIREGVACRLYFDVEFAIGAVCVCLCVCVCVCVCVYS